MTLLIGTALARPPSNCPASQGDGKHYPVKWQIRGQRRARRGRPGAGAPAGERKKQTQELDDFNSLLILKTFELLGWKMSPKSGTGNDSPLLKKKS